MFFLLLLFIPIQHVYADNSDTELLQTDRIRTVTMYKGVKYSLKTLLGDDYQPEKTYKLMSSDRTIVRYNKGVINARKTGTATFTVKSGTDIRKYKVKVVKPWIKVSMLDVQQGDSFLIQTANINILIDTGEYKVYSRLKSQLNELGVDKIDIVIASHFDTDHFGSVQSVLREYGAKLFIHPKRFSSSRDYNNLTAYLENNDITEFIPNISDIGNELSQLSVDGMIWTLLSSDAGTDTNDSSLVLHLSFDGSTWLFTGDASATVLNSVMAQYPDKIDVDILKVAHHGSDSSNPILFLKKSSPLYSLISVGSDNAYGHPVEEVISRLKAFTSEKIYRTDNDGLVIIKYTKKTFSISTSPAVKTFDTRNVSPTNIEQTVIGNIKSHVYHTELCTQLPAEKNRVIFSTSAEAEAVGYRAHTTCCR